MPETIPQTCKGGDAVTGLNASAKERLRYAGITQAAWARAQGYAEGRWHGDACGCPDDRCIGYHHDAGDDCGCLDVLLADAIRDRIAGGAR